MSYVPLEYLKMTLPVKENYKVHLDSTLLGQLSTKKEAAGKIRVFALVDIWTQSVLKPLHD